MTMKPDVGKAWDGVGGVSRLLSLRRSSWPIRERRRCRHPGEKPVSNKAHHVPIPVSDEIVRISNPLQGSLERSQQRSSPSAALPVGEADGALRRLVRNVEIVATRIGRPGYRRSSNACKSLNFAAAPLSACVPRSIRSTTYGPPSYASNQNARSGICRVAGPYFSIEPSPAGKFVSTGR